MGGAKKIMVRTTDSVGDERHSEGSERSGKRRLLCSWEELEGDVVEGDGE